jgi:hypothetical protein
MVYRTRKQLVEDGFEAVLSRKPRDASHCADFRRREGGQADCLIRPELAMGVLRSLFAGALGGVFFLFHSISAKGVVTILSMKIDLCCAAIKKNPERLNARGLVSCGLN